MEWLSDEDRAICLGLSGSVAAVSGFAFWKQSQAAGKYAVKLLPLLPAPGHEASRGGFYTK
jgi:hypothetical protein